MSIYRYCFVLFFFIVYSQGFGEGDAEELGRKIIDHYTKVQQMNHEVNQSVDELSQKVKYIINNFEKCHQSLVNYNNILENSNSLIQLMNDLGKAIRELMEIYPQNISKIESLQKFITIVTKDIQNCVLECQHGEGKAKKFYEALERLDKGFSDFEKKRLAFTISIEGLSNKIYTANESIIPFFKGLSEVEIKMTGFQKYCKDFLSDTKNINGNIINLKKSLEEIEKKGKDIDGLATNFSKMNKALIETEKVAIKVDEKLSKLHDKYIPVVEQDVKLLNQALDNSDTNIIRYNNNLESIVSKTREFNKEVSTLYPLLDDACKRIEKRKPLMVEMLQAVDKLTEAINKLHTMSSGPENILDTIFPRLKSINQEFEKYTAFLREVARTSDELMSHNSTLSKTGDTINVIRDAYERFDVTKKEEMVESLLIQCKRLEHMVPQLEVLMEKLEMVDSHKLEKFVNFLEQYNVASPKKMDELIDHIDQKVFSEIILEKKETDGKLLSDLSKMQEELRYVKYVTIAVCGLCLITPVLKWWMMYSFKGEEMKKYRSDKITQKNYNEAN